MADIYEKNEDGTYVGLDSTNFPAEVDSWQDSTDIDSQNLPFANAYREAMQEGNANLAQQILQQHPSLRRMRIDAATINQLKHAIMAVERLFKEDIEDYIISTSTAITGVDASLSVRGAPADAAATGTAIREVKESIADGSTHNHDNLYLKLTGGTLNGNLEVIGTINATGNISGAKVIGAVYNDYAEFFPRGEETEPGDIISLDCSKDIEQYHKAKVGENRIIGVHSDEFSHIIGGDKYEDPDIYMKENLKKYIPVGLVGRVHTKLMGTIRIGDYIVPSEISGVGRAYVDGDPINSIIGYAVESDNKTGIRRLKVKLGRWVYMIEKESPILPEDFIDLKETVKSELLRRGKTEGKGQNQSVGSMAAYASTEYDYTTMPDEGVKILYEHIQKLADPINAVKKAITVSQNDIILTEALNNLTTTIINLSSAAETAGSLEATGCSASCSGLCYSGCYSSCTSCTGSCSTSCRNGCTGSCSGGCSGGCSGTCKTGCSGCGSSCSTSCSSTCSGGCKGDCGATCSGSCDGTCTGSCSGGCTADCGFNCITTCTSGCGGCANTCNGCSGTCSVTCNDLAWWNK